MSYVFVPMGSMLDVPMGGFGAGLIYTCPGGVAIKALVKNIVICNYSAFLTDVDISVTHDQSGTPIQLRVVRFTRAPNTGTNQRLNIVLGPNDSILVGATAAGRISCVLDGVEER